MIAYNGNDCIVLPVFVVGCSLQASPPGRATSRHGQGELGSGQTWHDRAGVQWRTDHHRSRHTGLQSAATHALARAGRRVLLRQRRQQVPGQSHHCSAEGGSTQHRTTRHHVTSRHAERPLPRATQDGRQGVGEIRICKNTLKRAVFKEQLLGFAGFLFQGESIYMNLDDLSTLLDSSVATTTTLDATRDSNAAPGDVTNLIAHTVRTSRHTMHSKII